MPDASVIIIIAGFVLIVAASVASHLMMTKYNRVERIPWLRTHGDSISWDNTDADPVIDDPLFSRYTRFLLLGALFLFIPGIIIASSTSGALQVLGATMTVMYGVYTVIMAASFIILLNKRGSSPVRADDDDDNADTVEAAHPITLNPTLASIEHDMLETVRTDNE